MQKVAEAHDTELSADGSMTAGDDQLCPSKITALPALSTATQKVVVGQETADNSAPGSIVSVFQALEPP
jgi:hypothetical protein